MLAISPRKIKTIYRGRDIQKIVKWEPLKSSVNFKFIFLGRILESKGLSELLDAFFVLRKYSNIQLDIYGGGDYSKILNKKIFAASMQESVFLHGAVINGFTKYTKQIASYSLHGLKDSVVL
jgi:glycosyltransferase involved in cell wall biosynthesis